ncbi:MAG: alpha/beta hydrolase [Lysobacteraceae bacterium]
MSPTVERLHWVVGDDRVVGDLHRPAAARSPAVVVAGPMTSVKEQVTGTYAAALARRGIAALAIDHRHFGESGGLPRQYEHAGRKIEDLRAAVDVLAGHDAVDPDAIGLVGVCLGAGYAAHAAVGHPRVRALACVAGYYRDPAAIRAQAPERHDAALAQGVAARERYERLGEVATIPAAALDREAAMTSEDTVDYYTRRAAVANYRNAFAVMSREHFLPFDVQAAAPRIAVPTRMVHSEHALSPAWARRFHAAMTAPSALCWIDSAGQTDLYDDPGRVAEACDLVADHLAATFSAAAAAGLSAGPAGRGPAASAPATR